MSFISFIIGMKKIVMKGNGKKSDIYLHAARYRKTCSALQVFGSG